MIRVYAHPTKRDWRRYWFDCDACGVVSGPLDEPRCPPDPQWLQRKLEQLGGALVDGEGVTVHECCLACVAAGATPMDVDERERHWLEGQQLALPESCA